MGSCPFCSRDQNLVDSSPWELVTEKSLAVTHTTHSCTWPEPGDARSHLSPQSGGTSKGEAHGSGALTSVLSGSAGVWRSREENHWLAWIWKADVAVGLGPEKCLFPSGGLSLEDWGGGQPGPCASTPLALPPPPASHLLWGRNFAFTPGGH